MKKLLKRSGALLIVFAMLLSLTCISAFAADPPTISVSLADGSEAVDVTTGATTVYLAISITNNPGIASVQGSLVLPEGWSFVGADANGFIQPQLFYVGPPTGLSIIAESGSASLNANNGKFGAMSNVDVADDGYIMWVPVTIPAETVTGEYEIGLTLTEVTQADPNDSSSLNNITSSFGAVGCTVSVTGAESGEPEPEPEPDPEPVSPTGGTITVGDVELNAADGSVLVPVSITDNPGFAGLKVSVNVPDGLTAVSVKKFTGTQFSIPLVASMQFESNIEAVSTDPAEGQKVVVAMAGASDATDDGVLFWIELAPDTNAENRDYTVSAVLNEAFTADDIDTNVASAYAVSGGTVTVSGLPEGGAVAAGTAKFELTGTAASVLVPVSITDNPGFASMKLTVSVPEGWTTTKVYTVNNGEAAITAGMYNSYKIDANTNSDVVISFASATNVTGDGVLAWIEYVPGSSVVEGEYPITVTVNEAYSADDIDTNAAYVYTTAAGALTVTELKGGTVAAGTASINTAGETSVLVPVTITDNPGFASLKLTVSVPEGWTTTKVYTVNNGEAAITAGMFNSYKINANTNSDVVISFANATNVTGDGVLAWIEYVPGSSVTGGDYPITVTVNEAYSADDIDTNAAYVYTTAEGKIVSSPYTITISDSKDGTADVHAGDEVTLSVIVNGADFNGVQATVTYDSDLFTYDSCEGTDVDVDTETEGQIVLTRFSVSGLPNGTEVAKLTFTANTVDATTTGNFEISSGTADTFVNAAQNNALPALTAGDSVRIIKQFTVTFLDQDGEEINAYTVDDGAAVSEVPEAPSVDYHTFDKWYIGETGYTADEILKSAVTADVTYQAGYTANSYAVTLGDGLTDAEGNTMDVTATYGKGFTGRITGFDSVNFAYIITYQFGDGEKQYIYMEDIAEDGTFTIPGTEITGALSITLTKLDYAVDVVADYLTGYTLVTVTNLDSDTVTAYSYDGNAMYYVEAYGAYAWIVEGYLEKANAVELVEAVSEAAGTIAVGYDVNDTGSVDFCDAIAAFGSYKVVDEYPLAQFMAQYLRADVNGNQIVDSEDVSLVMGNYTNP